MSYNPWYKPMIGNQQQSMLSVIYRRQRFAQNPSWELWKVFNRADANDEREYQYAISNINIHHSEGITEYMVAENAKYFIGYPADSASYDPLRPPPPGFQHGEFSCSCECSTWGEGESDCAGPDHHMISKYFYGTTESKNL